MDPTLEFTTSISEPEGCAVQCKICPQALLVSKYRGEAVRFLRYDDFVTMLNKVPKNVRVDFSGYAEPFLNKDCGKMIQYAYTSGYKLAIYTTLIGADLSDLDILESMAPYDTTTHPLVVHLSDSEGVMPVTITPKYKALLENLVVRNIPGLQYMTMNAGGTISSEIEDIFRGVFGNSNWQGFGLVSRASTSDNVDQVSRISGRIQCKPMLALDHNVVLPNGNIQICCMDYGLEHSFGNLLRDDYEELFRSAEFKKTVHLMNYDDGGDDLICRKCEHAEQY